MRTQSGSQHAPDLLLFLELVECRGAKVAPPLEQHGLADELEPGREFQVGLPEHLLELVGGDVFGVAHLVRVDVEIDIRLDEEDVVNCSRQKKQPLAHNYSLSEIFFCPTHSHVRPISHRWPPCSGSGSGTRISPTAPAPP